MPPNRLWALHRDDCRAVRHAEHVLVPRAVRQSVRDRPELPTGSQRVGTREADVDHAAHRGRPPDHRPVWRALKAQRMHRRLLHRPLPHGHTLLGRHRPDGQRPAVPALLSQDSDQLSGGVSGICG